MAKTQETIVAIPALAPAVKTLATAYKKAESAQASIGAAVIKAADVVKLDQVETFVHMVKAALDGVIAETSIKVEATRIRRVLTCIIDGSLNPVGGETLRAMYNECPKDAAKGGRKGVTQLPNPANQTVSMADDSDDGDDDMPVATLESRAEKVKAAITLIFGYSEPALIDAVKFASANIPEFLKWATGAVQSVQMAELEKALTPVKSKRTKAPRATA